jgi:hypothetical protein
MCGVNYYVILSILILRWHSEYKKHSYTIIQDISECLKLHLIFFMIEKQIYFNEERIPQICLLLTQVC